ncbi:MAG TPA: hypothetical protein PLS67_05455 [Accumulibacter sp.]|nr:hypothetical protein [Accumulibacter sp.]HQC79952.1 hypothetical protein [Accumulibacter sp.]
MNEPGLIDLPLGMIPHRLRRQLPEGLGDLRLRLDFLLDFRLIEDPGDPGLRIAGASVLVAGDARDAGGRGAGRFP